MADHNNNNSNNDNQFNFPPPPTMTPPRTPPRTTTAAAAPVSGGRNLPPPVPTHATMENIPRLSSAPPSGNYDYHFRQEEQHQQQQQQLQPPAMMSSTIAPSMTSPPPPPPPPQQQQQQQHPTMVMMPPAPNTQQQQLQQQRMPPPPPLRQEMSPSLQMMTPPPPPVHLQQQQQQQQQQQSIKTPPPPPPPAAGAVATPTMVNLPPPPPMPRTTGTSPQSTSSTTGSSSSVTATSSLPPPPVMSGTQQRTGSSGPTSTAPLKTTSASNNNNNNNNINAAATSPWLSSYSPPTQEPPAIPLTTFAPQNTRFLADRQSYIPILVLGTESAHKMAWKNQLRLVDLFQGLGRSLPDYAQRQIPPFRSIANKSLHLQWKDVPLRFVTPAELAVPMEPELAQDLLQQQAQLQPQDGNLAEELNLLEEQIDGLLQDPREEHSYDYMSNYEMRQREQAQVVKDAFALTSPSNIPWALRYRHALDASTDQMPHDLISCPPVCLLICTTQEISPLIECLRELGSRHYLPHCFQNGLMDPEGMRQEALVLHDTVEGPRDWNEAGLRSSLQRHFGPNASVVRINGIQPQTALQLSREETVDEWGGGGQCGNCLSHSDRVVLRQYLESLTLSSVLPALEKRMADLNVFVSEKKKGVKNVFKSFWRKPKESNPEETVSKATSEVAYRYDSIESQTRLLADTLFLVKDFDAALAMYRLIRDDYKHDKAMMHYASIQEMMAICMYFLDPYSRARDIVSHIETALLAYSKAAEDERPALAGQNKNLRADTAAHATLCATRLCLWLASTSDTILSGRHLEVADLLASASSHETSLGAAVLLEQSSAQYFHANMHRKYAFHMLMSGHMFRTAQQDSHAFRCFTSALYLYRDKPWSELHNHLRSALAAQLYAMGRMSVSVQLYAKLVGIPSGGSVSVKSQQKFVNNLLFICNEHSKKALVGADRMAAPSELSNIARDRYRQERLDSIVRVIEFTKGAHRVLELPRVRLPTIDDNSIIVVTPEDDSGSTSAPSSIGKLGKGSEDVWNELQLTTAAELKAYDVSKDQFTDDEVITKALSKIQDTDIRRVIAQIDKAKQAQILQERFKRSSSYKGEKPPTRARGEPLRVQFTMTNPLSIPVDMSDMQLVAKITSKDGRVFTNHESIKITASGTERKPWMFKSSDLAFHVAEFSRLSPASDSESKSWTAGEDVDTPYFVVSKQSLDLEEQGTSTVSLSICPLVEGSLAILGVRSRLFDDVWLYHPFNVQGPLLHTTRENRANRVRAKSVLLQSTIQDDMPCLTACVMRSNNQAGEDHLLQGQTGDWILRLSNIGTAPATNVTLKTNLPWISIPANDNPTLDKENTTESKSILLENNAKSCCVGPTGTLMKLPIHGSQLQRQGSIQPGETVDVAIRIKASACGGTHDFYMLYRYELDTSSSTSGSSRPHRWLKRLRQVPVYPSLSLSASVLPFTFHKSEYVLTVEVSNHRNDRPSGVTINLEKLNLFSRQYRLERMPGQFLSGDGSARVAVDWRERVTLHYRLVPLERKTNACLLSECPFTEGAITSVEGSLSFSIDYLCLEKTCSKFENTWKAHQIELLRAQSAKDKEDQHPESISQIRRANRGQGLKTQESGLPGGDDLENVEIGAAHPTSISKLFPVERSLSTVNLVCSWSAEMSGATGGGNARVVGEHLLSSVLVRPTLTTNDCPITISASHPSTVEHDFSTGGVTIPFRVTLRNQLVQSPVKFRVEIVQPKYFDFVGAQSLRWTLDGSQELVLPLKAVISCPGVFNLQSIKLFIYEGDDDGSDTVAFDFGVQWMVNVSPTCH